MNFDQLEDQYAPIKPPPMGAMPDAPAINPATDAALSISQTGGAAPIQHPAIAPIRMPQRTDQQYQPIVPHGWRKALGLLGVGLTAFNDPAAGAKMSHNLFQAPKEQAEARFETDTEQANKQQTEQTQRAKEESGAEHQRAQDVEQRAKAEKELREPPEKPVHPPVPVAQGAWVYNKDEDKWEFQAGEGGKGEKVSPAHIKYDSGIPVSVEKGDQIYDVNDPNLPDEFKPLVSAAQRAHGQHVQEQEELQKRVEGSAAARQAAGFAQAEKMAREREDQPTATTKTMHETAPKVSHFLDRIEPEIDKLSKDLGPAAGRWSEFWAGKIGSPKPEYTQLRTNMMLLSTLLMRMHMGARGGEQIMEHFRSLLDQGKQSPENLKASLHAIRDYASDLQGGQPGKGGETSVTPANDKVGDAISKFRAKQKK